MRYQCVQCDQTFDVPDDPGDGQRPRCPKCLRQHGLRKLEGSARAAASAPRGKLPLVLLALGLLAAGGGAFAYWKHAGGHGADLTARLQAAGVEAGELAQLFAADASVEQFAEAATKHASSPAAKAKAISDAISARGQKQAFVRWPMSEPREGGESVLGASQVLAKISKDGARAQLYPLEVAALGLAALRSADVPSAMVEVFAYPNERAPLDASGRFGYYALATLDTSGDDDAHAKVQALFDPFGGRAAAPDASSYTLLSDAQVIGAALAVRAQQRLNDHADSAGALADADAAVKLAPSSPTVRSARATILISSGGADEGGRELEAAAQMRGDAPRHANLAVLAVAKGDAERAGKEIALALSVAPDYALAHLTLASVHLARGERDLAESELRQAESIEPNLAAVSMAWAELYASRGDVQQALPRAEQAVRARPKNPETHLVLARVCRLAGRYDEMREHARKVLELATITDKDRVKKLLESMLGPTALEERSEPSAAAGDAVGSDTAVPGGLQLGSPQAGATPGAGLQLGAGEPKLRLGGGDGKLKLKLNP